MKDMDTKKSVTIIDNSVLFANAMGLLVQNIFKKQLLAKLTFEDELTQKFQSSTPDIALIAFDNVDENHINRINELINKFPETSFFALCDKKDNQFHSHVKEYGFEGFINKLNFIKDFRAILDSFQLIHA